MKVFSAREKELVLKALRYYAEKHPGKVREEVYSLLARLGGLK